MARVKFKIMLESATPSDDPKGNEGAEEMFIVFGIVIFLLTVIIAVLMIYIATMKWKKGKRRRREHDLERGGHSATTDRQRGSPYIISGAIQSLMDFRMERSYGVKANPCFISDDLDGNHQMDVSDDHRVVVEVGAGTADGTVPYRQDGEEDDIQDPSQCSSRRGDGQLSELMKTDMTESVTVEVDNKLLVFISKEVDHTGGSLVLDKMGISLFIPPCAIAHGKTAIIQLVLDWDLSDFPSMKSTQTIVSPVVHCGPHGLKLKKPAILSFMHCADKTQDILVMSSETHLTHDKHWTNVAQRGLCGKTQYALLENQCQLYLSHFSLYTCLAEGPLPKPTKKWIQLVAFGSRKNVGEHYQVFIYMLNNTPCALQFASQQQAKQNFCQLRCPMEFLFDEEGGDLVFKLGSISEGWSSAGHKVEERGLFPDIWQGRCNNISFVYKHENPRYNDLCFDIGIFQENVAQSKSSFKVALTFPTAKNPYSAPQRAVQNIVNVNLGREFDSGVSAATSETASVRSVVIEERRANEHVIDDVRNDDEHDHDGHDEREADVIRLKGCCGGETSLEEDDESHNPLDDDDEMSKPSPSSPIASSDPHASAPDMGQRLPCPPSMQTINITLPTTSPTANPRDRARPEARLNPSPAVFPHSLRVRLSQLLDPPCALGMGNDWRLLAEKLGQDSMVSINYLKTRPSPTDELLDIAVQRRKDCHWLAGVLRDGGRDDAAAEVVEYLMLPH